MDANTINLIIGIAAGALTIFAYFKGFFGWLLRNIKNLFKPSGSTYDIPKKTLVLLPKASPNMTWWHMGSSGGKPAMQVVGKLTVTNITKYNILLTLVKMKKPRILGHVMCRKVDANIYGSYMIPGGATTDLSYDFWIIPPFKEKGESFNADIAVLDQFGNQHWVKSVKFPYH